MAHTDRFFLFRPINVSLQTHKTHNGDDDREGQREIHMCYVITFALLVFFLLFSLDEIFWFSGMIWRGTPKLSWFVLLTLHLLRYIRLQP